MKVVHVAFSTNDRIAMPLGVVISGLLEHLSPGSRASLNVVTKGISADHRRRLEHVVRSYSTPERVHSLTFHTISEATFADLPTIGRLSREAYFRLLLPELLPDLDRVVYLDADLVVGRDLTELYETPMGEAPIAAATQSALPPSRRSRASATRRLSPTAAKPKGWTPKRLTSTRACW